MQPAEKDGALLREPDAELSALSQGPYALPLISVIVPIYNVEVYLDRCIESICGQTYQNLEIILVDDGSPDNYPAICDAWAERDSRITVIHQENKGVSAARNAGLCAMKGEYFGFIDSDDYILPRYFEHLYGLVVDYNADMALSKFLMIDENGAAVPSELLRTRINAGIYRGKDILEEIFLIYVWGKLYRSEVCQKYRFPENRAISEDVAWLCAVLPDCGIVAVSSKKLYRYTRRKDSAAHEMLYELQENKLVDMAEVSMELYRQLKAKGMPKPAFRALQGAFYILNQTIVFGIYWKNGNYRVINRIRRSLIREIWHEEKLKSIPMLVRIAANIFNDTVIKRLKHHLFGKSSRFRKWMMLKKRHDR